MSDAPILPESGNEDADPPPRFVRRLAGGDTMGSSLPLDAVGAEPILLDEIPAQTPALEASVVADPPATLEELLDGIAPWTPETEPPSEPYPADDLLLPEVDASAAEGQAAEQPEAQPFTAPEPYDLDADVPPAPARPAEVSPILDALDAAEEWVEQPQPQPGRPPRGLFGHAAEAETFIAPPDMSGLTRVALAQRQAAAQPTDPHPPEPVDDGPVPMPTPRDWPEETEGESVPFRMPRLPIMPGMHADGQAEPQQGRAPAGPVADALDAAAKIAAEASAAAEALENLKRLLGERPPDVETAEPPATPPPPPAPPQMQEVADFQPETHEPVVRPPALVPERREAIAAPAFVAERRELVLPPPAFAPERREAIAAPAFAPQRREPVLSQPAFVPERREAVAAPAFAPERREPMFSPPPVPPRSAVPPRAPAASTRSLAVPDIPASVYEGRGQSAGVILRGFLAGLGLSLVAGAVLYVFMSIG
jgi:hypothetical protein